MNSIEQSITPLISNDKESERYIFSEKLSQEELKKSLFLNSNLFCKAKNSSIPLEGETFIECLSCMRDYCSTCYSLCHKNRICSGNIKEIEDNTVYEYTSSCHCDHNLHKKTTYELHLPCFYRNFLNEQYEIKILESKQDVNKEETSCLFCKKHCPIFNQNIQNLINFSNSVNNTCSCGDSEYYRFDLLDLSKLFHSKYSQSTKKSIDYREIIPKLKENLNIFFEEIGDKIQRENVIQYNIIIFSIHNIMYNERIKISYFDEVRILKTIMEKLKNNDKMFIFNKEKINLPMTYMLHFYKKYFFSQIQMMTIDKINLMEHTKRVEIMSKNLHFVNTLIRKSIVDEDDGPDTYYKDSPNIFSREFIRKFFYKMKKITNCFSIKLSNLEKNIPFFIYFVKLFFESYCFYNNYVTPFFYLNESVTYNKFKKNHHHYNFMLRKMTDEAFYISQLNHFDKMSFDLYESHEKNNLLNFPELFYFHESSGYGTHFFDWCFKINFYNKNKCKVGAYSDEINNNPQKKISTFELSKTNYQETLFFFDCFNNNFITNIIEIMKNCDLCYLLEEDKQFKNSSRDKYFEKIDNFDEQKLIIENNVKQLLGSEDEPNQSKSDRRTHFVLYKNMAIENIQGVEKQDSLFMSYIDSILNKFELNFNYNEVQNHAEFMNFLISKLKSFFKNETVAKEIDISSYLNRKKIINTAEIDLRPFEKEIKFILYKFFVLRLYKFTQIKDFRMKWNLLLFLFFCNNKNTCFILSELNFLEFLFENSYSYNEKGKLKSYLIYSMYKSDEIGNEVNFIWKVFYFAFKYSIERNKEFGNLKILIIEKFINFITNSLLLPNKYKNANTSNSQIKTKNYSLVYYFLKIINRLLIQNDLSSCLPYNFNVNKYEIGMKINLIANMFFESNFFDIDKYFDSIYLYQESNSPQTIKNYETYEDKMINSLKDEINHETINLNFEMRGLNTPKKYEKGVIGKNSRTYKKIQIENIQLILLDILGSFYSTNDLNIYFKIINRNLLEFLYFFKNKKEYRDKENLGFSNDKIFRIEITLMKFLLNFLTLKDFDYSNINLFTETNISKQELKIFGNNIVNGMDLNDIKIDLKEDPTKSKYFMTNMKIKILNEFDDYLINFDQDFYPGRKYNKGLGMFLLNHISLFFRNLKFLSGDKQTISELGKHYAKVIITFFEIYPKFFSFEAGNLKGVYNFDIDKIFENSENYYSSKYGQHIAILFKNLKINKTDISFLKNYNTNYLGFNSDIEEYFKNFIVFDGRKHSKYSKLVNDFILFNSESKKRIQEHKRKLVIYFLKKFFSDHSRKTNIKCLKEEQRNIDKNRIDVSKNSIEIKNKILFEFWGNVSKKFSADNSEDVNQLLKYIFDSLNVFDESQYLNFDNLFSENFLKSINFLNNLLYHNPLDIEESLLNYLTEERMRVLLVNVLKINNYIIGISNHENNAKLLSLSKIYFTLMDFFILLHEGLKGENFLNFFFMNLSKPKGTKQSDTDKKVIFVENTDKNPQENNEQINQNKKRSNLNQTNRNKNTCVDFDPDMDENKNPSGDNFNLRENAKLTFGKNKVTDHFYSNDVNNLNLLNSKYLKGIVEGKNNILSDKGIIGQDKTQNNLLNENLYLMNGHEEESKNEHFDYKIRKEQEALKLNDISRYINEEPNELVFNKGLEGRNKPKLNFLQNLKENDVKKIINGYGKGETDHLNESAWIEYDPEKENNEVNDNLINDDEEEENPEDNFYYYTFLQLKLIANSINFRNYKDFSHGCNRLILQFLYIVRFLREYLEIEDREENVKIRKIINYCFLEIFDLVLLRPFYIKNEDYSLILRYELINLFCAYLEENYNESSEKILNKFSKEGIYPEDFFPAIATCFEEIVKKIYKKKNIIDPGFDQLKFDFLFNSYLEDESIFLNNKYFDLAESYYRLLRLIDPFYRDLKASIENLMVKKKDDVSQFYGSKNPNQITNQRPILYMQTKYNSVLIIFYKFMKKIGREIEVKFQESTQKFIFRKIFYFMNPKCFYLDSLSKLDFMEKTPRTTLGEKLDYFNKKLDKFLLNINASYKYKSQLVNSRLIDDFNGQSGLRYLDTINFTLVLILNILILTYFYEDSSNDISKKDLNSQMFLYKDSVKIQERLNYVFYTAVVFSFIQLGLLTIWFTFRFNVKLILGGFKPLLKKKYLLTNKTNGRKTLSKSLLVYDLMFEKFANYDTKFLNMETYNLESFLKITQIKIKVFFKSEIFYILFSFISNILYLITNYKLLLVLPIISITKLYALFNYFYTAMRSKYKEFVALLIFIYIVEYIISWLSFLHFQEFMIGEFVDRTGNLNDNDASKELLCSTALECFLNYLDLGLRLGGGMGDSSPRLSFKFQPKRLFFTKLFWDILFHILVNLILSNIFFGVIVDTFNDLRDERDKKTLDKDNKCFMCNRDRYDNGFDEDFDYHRAHQHYVFNYVFFIPYLLKKNPQEYSRAELFAWQQINLRKLDWYPSKPQEGNN